MTKYRYDHERACMVNAETGEPSHRDELLPENFGRGIYVTGDYPGYDCPVTGKWIDGKREHEENLKRHGCRLIEKGEKDAMIKRKKEDAEDLTRRMEHTAAQVANSMGLD